MTFTAFLTGLPTRSAWLEQAGRILRTPRRDEAHTLVLLADLTKFKAVNDTYGHAAGDALLKAQAERLAMWTRGHGVAGRLGGDELVAAVMLDRRDIDPELDHLGLMLSKPVVWDRSRVDAPAAIGVAYAAGHCLEVLMAAADRAMYRVKSRHVPGRWADAEPDEYASPEARPVHRARHQDARTPTAER